MSVAEPTWENLVHMVRGIQRAAYRADLPLPHEEGADTFMGVDIRPSGAIDRHSVVAYGGVAYMHPHTLEVLKIALPSGRKMSDPAVQLEASLALIHKTLERREQQAISRMRNMARTFALVADLRHQLTWCEMERDRHAYVQWSREHYQLNTWECFDCGQQATDESLRRFGVDLGQ